MARGNRQRPPLHHFAVSDSNAATNPNLRIPPRTSSTINTKTSISAASSNIPTAISPSTPISSSIQSFSSVHSTTVTSHLNSTLKDKDKQKDKSKNNESDMNKLTKPKGGFFGSSKSTTNSTTSVSKNANPASKKQGNNQDNRGTTSSISKNDSSAPVLPLLLSDDFDFSLPFLSDSISTANSSSSASKVSPTPVVITSSAPLTLSSPSISALSPSYPHSRPPNSSSPPSPRVQDYIDSSPATPVSTAPTHVLPKSGTNSSLYNNNSSSQKKPTEIIHQSTRRGSSRPEISDYFVGNNDDLSTKQSSTKSLKSLNKATHESDFSNHERSETPANTRTPTNDDYQTPPRFVIRQPSRPALSNEFETTSKPSSTISMISLGSSSHAQSLKSQQRQLNRHTIDTPLQQKQMSDVSRSSPSPRPVAIVRKERAFSDVSTRPSEIKSLSSSAKSSPVSTKSLTTGIEPNSPNLRSRLTRLFRPNPKSDRPSSSNLEQQRRRSSQQKITNQTQGSSIPRPRGLTVPAPTSKMQGRLQGSSQLPSQLLPQSKLEQLSHQKQEHQQEQTASLLPLILPTSNLASNFTQDLSSQNSFSVTDNPPDILVSEGKQYEADSSRGAESSPEDTQKYTLHSTKPILAQPSTVSSLESPQTIFNTGAVPILSSSPASPLTREESKARQRRVSSVSSNHSIRQVGAYGGGYVNPNKMISPARKANPYYSSVVARFANGGKHSLHDRDASSSSGRRRSMVSVGGERAKVGAEAMSSREKLSSMDHPSRRPSIASTTHSVVYERKDNGNIPPVPPIPSWSSSTAAPTITHPMFTAAYTEEYDVEKDSVRGGVYGLPFGTINGKAFKESTFDNPRLHINNLSEPTTPRTYIRQPGTKEKQNVITQTGQEQPSIQAGQSTTGTTWSTATGVQTDIGTIPDSISTTMRTDSELGRGTVSFDSHDSDADLTPSVTTLSSAQIQNYRQQGIVTTEENWDDAVSHAESTLPVVLVQRPSMEVSILPDQPPFAQSSRPMSTASSIISASSEKASQQQQSPKSSKKFASMGPWSESSYDSCAPLRWDELFDMDPNSKGPLWLSDRGLGQIPHEFFDGLRNLRELYLDHNDIKVVPDSLLKLSKLDVLDLSCNSISSFHSAFKFKKLKNLRRLNLDHNMLTDISPIYKLKALRELRLNHNFVPYLAITIHNMTKLKILAMESNSLATLPETMGKLGNLCELRLSDNNLRTLPESIGSIRTLQVLALRSNLLEKLPESWKDMENLSTLDLSCNRLKFLPGDIVRLPKLTHLDLHDNQIEALPEKIGQLSSLVVLQLCGNQLRELPRDIGRLRDLQDLVLSFNQLQYLPDEIGKLNKLQELKFNNNPLRSLPKTIQRLTNVRRVYLQGCLLRDLPIEFGVVFRDLVYLDLSGNQFEVLPALDQMTKLEEFYISYNQLREIGTSSLNLQGSGNTGNSYPGNSSSGPTGPNTGHISHSQSGSGSMSQSGLSGSAGLGSTIGGNMATVQGSSTLGGPMVGGGVTASKLSELQRLRVFEAQGNQIRVLSNKIKLLPKLEVLDLADNFLTWLPKEVGDLTHLKVLILEGNPIKALPSSLSKLMGTLEVFRIGVWPENGFEITRDQSQINMKISAMQSFMPQQIERTLLMRMHESILRRIQELDSQQYRDQKDMDKSSATRQGSKSLVVSSSRLSASTYSLAANALQSTRPNSPSPESRSRIGLTQELTIATQNMIINRSFALPPASPSDDGTSDKGAYLTVNSEGINPHYVEYNHPNIRTLPTLQLSGFKGHSAPITTLPLTSSPQAVSAPTGPVSSFPLLNSLRPRKSQQQLTIKNSQTSGSRPRTMYTFPNPLQQEASQLDQQQFSPSLSDRVSRVFDFANSGKQKSEGGIRRVETLESSQLPLSSDTMAALGLGTQSGLSAGMAANNQGTGLLGRGDGSLASIKSSMAIKSSPSLTSVPLPIFPTSPPSPLSTNQSSGPQTTRGLPGQPVSSIPGRGSTPLRRSASSIGGLWSNSSSEKPWLRLKSSLTPSQELYQNPMDFSSITASVPSNTTSISTSLLMPQPTVNGQPISNPTPPPILLDYDLDTSSSLDIPSHLYYSAGGDDVDGDHPDTERDQETGAENETEDDDMVSTTTGGYGTHFRSKGKARMSDTADSNARPLQESYYVPHQQSYYQQSATDPVLKIAVLKSVYDQILQNMDQLVEHNVQESPAKKNNRFKLLNTLRFLKADRNGGSGASSSGSYQQQQPQQYSQHHHHQHSFSGTWSGHHQTASTSTQ